MDYVDSHDSGYGEDDSTPSSVHPDRFDHEHIAKLEEFSQDLQKAIANSFPRPSASYTSVHVLLLRWAEDDLNVQVELSSLKAVFENQYLFAAEQWDIPTLSPTRALQAKLYEFQNCHQCEDELLIVYYGGHGDADRRRGRSIWAANRKPDSPTLTWSSLQHLLENALPYVLIILDCCYAANAARDTSEGTTKEIIAACGRENPTLGVGERSFTSALISELQAFGSQPFTVAMLHSRLITMRWRLAFTPVYALLSEHGGHSIELAPQPAPAQATQSFNGDNPELDEDMMDISAPEARIAQDTRVLLSVSISDDATCDIAEWKQWLTHEAPRIVTQIEVEAVFKSHSTMLMTSLPTVAWDCLPDKAAYRFIGFIKSGNLDRTHPCSEEECQHLAATVSEQQRHLSRLEKKMGSEVMSTLEKLVKNRGATDVDELYKLRLEANQQLKALELMKTPSSIGRVEIGDSSTQGQAEDPVPETGKQRLSAAQKELTPNRFSEPSKYSTPGQIETKIKRPAKYAMPHLSKHGPSLSSQLAVEEIVPDSRIEPRETGSIPDLKPGVMTGHGNTMSPTANNSSKSLPKSTESDNLQSFDTLVAPLLAKTAQSSKFSEGMLGTRSSRSSEPTITATMSNDSEQATSRSKRKRSHAETGLSPLDLLREAPGLWWTLGGSISVTFSCQSCRYYQANEIYLDQDDRVPPEVELRCERCNYIVRKNLNTAENGIQSITPLESAQDQPQGTSANHTRTRTTQINEEQKDTQPLLAQTLPWTFLVAVRNKDIRQLLLSKLSTLGYSNIYEASDGKEAVQKVARSHSTRGHGEKPINVVFMDPLLPIMNGYEATRNIRALDRRERRGQFTSSSRLKDDNAAQTKPGVTVLAVSAATSDAARKRAMAVGMNGYVTPDDILLLGRLLMDYCTNQQIKEGRDNDAESSTSNSWYFRGGTGPQNRGQENKPGLEQRKKSATKLPRASYMTIGGSDELQSYIDRYNKQEQLEGTTTDAIPAGSVRQAELRILQEQESARSPSSSASDTTVYTPQRPESVWDGWDESELEELATVYMRYRENTWSFLAGQLGKDWDIIEGKCFEKGIEELLRLAQNADSKLHASVIEEDEASSLEGELPEPTSFKSQTDSAIGMD